MGFLKGFLRKAEEEIADILPGGKTGKSIRAQRKAPVAKTVSRPRDESKSWLSKDFNPVSDGINDIKSAFKYASKDWKSSENQRQVDTQNANRQILKKYTQGQLNKNQVESLVGSKVKNAGLKKKGNLYVNTVKNSTGETLLQNTGAGIMNAAPQRVIGGLAEYGGTALGNDSIRDFGTRLNQPFRDYNALAYENADNKAVAIGGNIAGNLLTLPIAPAGKAGLAYRGVVAGAPTAADTGYAIKQAGGGRVAQTIGGGATGIASGYLNSVGGDKILKPVGAVTSKLVGKTVTTKLAPTAFGRIGAGVLNEGGEEVIEQGVDNAVAKSTYDPDRKLTENLATSFLLGGAMGGVVRGGVELGNPNTRTQLINESKVKDIANDQGGFVSGRNAKDFKQAEAEGKVFEGVDGKPRFEVSDEGAKLRPEAFNPTNKLTDLEALKAEARKYKSAEEFTQAIQDGKVSIPKGSPEQIAAIQKQLGMNWDEAYKTPTGVYDMQKKVANDLYNQAHTETKTPTPQAPQPTSDPNRNWKLSNQVDEGYRVFSDTKELISQKMDEFTKLNNGKPFTPAQKKELQPLLKQMEDGLNLAKKANTELYSASPAPKGEAQATQAPKGEAPDPTAALKQEALKYKSADEFVESRGIPIYHRSPNKFNEFDISKVSNDSNRQRYGWGLYFSDTIPHDQYGKNLYEARLPKGTFIDSKQPVDEKIVNRIVEAVKANNKNPSELDEFSYSGYLFYKTLSRILGGDKEASLFLSKNGIDGLKSNIGKNANDYILFNDKSIKTKQELTSLYNEAHSGKAMSVEPKADPLESLKQEASLYRGMNATEWNDVFNGGVSANKKNGLAFVGSKDDAVMATEAYGRAGKKGNVIVEYKPEARKKLVSGENLGQNTGGSNLSGEYQAKGLGLSDIARVTDENGKVIYEATQSQPPKSTAVQPDPLESLKQEARKYKSADEFQHTTGDPKIDAKIKHIAEMTPDEYLRQAFEATDGKLGGSYDSWLASNAQDAMVAKKYAEAMQNGDKFPLPYIDKAMGSQDGRNRAIAAKLAGKEKIPVGIVPEMTTAEKIAFAEEQVKKYPEKSYLGNKYRRDLTDLYNQATQSQPPKAPVEGKASNQGVSDRRKPVQDKVNRTEPKRTETAPKPTLQDALDGKSTKIEPKVVKTEPKIPKVAPKRTETAPKKPFIPDEIKAIRAKREANTSQQTRTDQTRKNQQALDSKSSVQSQPESKVAPRTGVQSISQAVQGRVNKISPQKARQGIGSKGRQGLLSGLSSKDTIQLSGVNVNDPFNNRKIGKRLKNEFGRYFVDEDAEMINLMKRIEKETGQKDLVETWLQDSDLVRNTNSIANSKIRRNENLKLALRGLSKKQQASFDEYASARTELSNLERGLESSSKPKEQLQQIVRDGNIDFGNRFIALNNYYGDWAKDLHDAGIISKSKLDDWSQNKDYVRVQRDMEDILNYTPPTGKSRSFGTTSTSKKRTGSTREILSPTNIALERGQQLQLEIQRNKAASNTIDTLEKYGLAEKVSQQYATGKNVVKRFKDGKVEYFATSKDVKRVIENVNPFQLGVLGRVISTPTRLFRSGTTALSAPFATTNYVRDQISSAIYSDQALPRLSKTAQGNVEYIAGTHSPKNIVSGIASATKDYFGGSSNPLWEKFEQVAGDQTQFDEMRNTRSSKATMRELRQGGKGALINKIVNPVRSMEDLIGITEKATRFQNFKGIYEAEMKRSGNEKIATQKASQAALQNSVNFTRAGKAMRVINLLLPYSNAGIQGSRNVARSFRKRPVATTMKSVAFVAVPTVLLTLMNYDDEETAKVYKNIDDTEKDDNFIIVLKGAKQNEAGSYEGIIKIPKPQGYRELTNPLRIAAERFAGNEKSGDVSKMVRDAMSAFTGPVSIEDSGKFISSLIPQAVKPTLQAIENKDYYWDSQTVPDYMIDGTDDPTKRAYKSTSGTARIIADQLGVSPILVEKFIQDTAGSVGRYGINLTDRGLNKLGIVKDDQIGGKTITGDFKRRTTEARAIEKTNKTDGQRYYDNVEKATGELPKYLQDSWKSYNTSDKNFLGEVLFEKNGQAKKQAKAAAYIEHPELFEVDKKLDKLNRKKGETGNPLYDLSYNQALIVVQEKALPPGAKDEGLNALYDQQWYSQYKNKEEKYYDKIFGKGGIEENKDNPYPERSPDLISAMDSYYDLPSSYAKGAWKKANPGIASQMEAYYSAKDAWTNTERAKLGLPPIEDRYAKYESSSGKSGSSGGSRGRSRRGSSGGSSGSRKGKFDYKFGAFAPGEIGSKKSLRKILEEAQL